MSDLRPLGLALYTVRDMLKEDFAGTVRRVAEIGYTGVETAGFPGGFDPKAAKQLFDDLDLSVISAHSKLPVGDDTHEVLDTMQTIGASYLVCPWLSPEDYFSSLDGVKRACEMLNAANEVTVNAGLRLLYHNHWFEFLEVEGRLPYQLTLELLDDRIGFEIDTYWVRTAGQDPLKVVQEIGSRAPLLHIKDGPAEMQKPMLPAGLGVMDFPPIVRESAAEWLIIELDRYDGDMMQAVEKSYAYMTEEGLAHGRQ